MLRKFKCTNPSPLYGVIVSIVSTFSLEKCIPSMRLVERFMNAKFCSHTIPMVTIYFVMLLCDNLHRRNV